MDWFHTNRVDWVRDGGQLRDDNGFSPFLPIPSTPVGAEAAGRRFRARVDSVSAWQGDEADVIVMSLVRSNASGEVGFLDDRRIFNVALTRARRGLVIFADARTFKYGRNAGFPQFLAWCHDARVVARLEFPPLGSRTEFLCRPIPIGLEVTSA